MYLWRGLSSCGVCEIPFRLGQIGLSRSLNRLICFVRETLSRSGTVALMLTAIGIILSLAFIGWLIWRAVKRKPIKAYMAMYGLSCVAGIFTLAFFLSMDISKMVKILACIILGGILIYLAAQLQQRTKARSV